MPQDHICFLGNVYTSQLLRKFPHAHLSTRVQNISGRHIRNKIRGGMVVLTSDRVVRLCYLTGSELLPVIDADNRGSRNGKGRRKKNGLGEQELDKIRDIRFCIRSGNYLGDFIYMTLVLHCKFCKRFLLVFAVAQMSRSAISQRFCSLKRKQ